MELFRYDPAEGILYWRNGRRAGYIAEDGYIRVNIKKKNYMAHNLIWAYMTGKWPVLEVDHSDNCGSNNKWSNLRAATRSQQLLNTRVRRDNALGIKNVHLHKPSGKYQVKMRIQGKDKSFGYYSDLELADLVATEARDKFHGEFAKA